MRGGPGHGHADEAMVRSGQVREADRLGNDAADEAADFGRRRVGLVTLSLMLVVICLGFVVACTLLFLTFIVSSLLLLVLWSILMVVVVLLLIHLYGLLVLFIRGVGWFMRFVTGLFCPGLLVFGTRNGFKFQLLLSVLRILPNMKENERKMKKLKKKKK